MHESGAEAAAGMFAAGAEVIVELVKQPRPDVHYPAVVVDDDGDHVVVRAPWAGPPVRDFGYVRFEQGDIFTEHYWRRRWYSIKEVRDGAGTLKGWYCDVCRPAVVRRRAGREGHAARDALVVQDLDLDLWLSADRATVLRLDEDEFDDSGLEKSDPDAAAHARRALDELERLARGARGFAEVLG